MCLFDHFKKKKQHYDLFIVFVFMFLYLSLRPILQYLFQQKVAPCSTSHCSCLVRSAAPLTVSQYAVQRFVSLYSTVVSRSGIPVPNLSAADGRHRSETFSQMSRHLDCVFKSYFFALYNTFSKKLFSKKQENKLLQYSSVMKHSISAVEQLNRRQ